MNSTFRDSANNVLKALPVIRKLPFFIGWSLVRVCSFLTSSRLQIDVRNSYALGYYEPLYSDIDVTVIGDRADLISFISRINKLRSKLPIIGELNAFEIKDAQEAAFFANPYELFRDPLLQKMSQKSGPSHSPTDADKIVFIIKMLEADYRALKFRPNTRKQKWNHHFEMLFGEGLKNQEPSLNVILNVAGKHLKFVDEEFKTSLLKYFSELESGRALHLVAEDYLSQNPWWWSCFPNRFCFLPAPEGLTVEQKKILIRSLDWEIFGILAQKLQMNLSTTQKHLVDLRKVGQAVLQQNELPVEDRALLEAATASSLFSVIGP